MQTETKVETKVTKTITLTLTEEEAVVLHAIASATSTVQDRMGARNSEKTGIVCGALPDDVEIEHISLAFNDALRKALR